MAESIDDDVPAMSITVYTDTTCSETIQIDKNLMIILYIVQIILNYLDIIKVIGV